MDQIKDIYKNWVREEIENPDVQKAKEVFLRKHFETVAAGPSFRGLALSPAFRLAFVGCFALAVLVKIGAFETQTVPTAVLTQPEKITVTSAPSDQNKIQINKLGSDMGPTVAYQKHFSDVQITVLWVFPKGA